MLILTVIFVVLMMFWLFAGWNYGPSQDPKQFGAGTLIPWLCVAILGWVIFNYGTIIIR